MSAAARAFPASPILATWWQQFAHLSPRELWFAHLTVQRVEALARVEQIRALDPLTRRILDALARTETIEAVEQHTGLHRQFLHRALVELRAHGLLESEKWRLSAAGRQAHESGSYTRLVSERRAFHFRVGLVGPRFLPLTQLVGEPCQPGEQGAFEIATLADCLKQSREWKEQQGFPTDVQALVPPDVPAPADWRAVTVVTPLRLTAMLAVTERVQGFACADDDGTIDPARPIFALGFAGLEVFPELTTPPSDEACAAAWRDWCAAQHHPELAAGCRVELQGHRLWVTPAAALDERLYSLAHESWLLIGSEDIRRVAQINIRTA